MTFQPHSRSLYFVEFLFTRLLFSLPLFCCLSAHSGEGLALPVHLEEVAGFNRTDWPVRGGIPFPKGKLAAGAEKNLQLLDPAGNAVPMLARVAAKWEDGSTKWLWLDAQASLKANQKEKFTLKSGASVGPKQTLKVSEDAEAIRVDTGTLQFEVLKKRPGGLGKIMANGKVYAEKALPDALLFDYQTKGPGLNSLTLRGSYKRDEVPDAKTIRLTASAGKDYKARLEISTPLRVVIRTEGWYGAEGQQPAGRYVVRYTAFAGKPFIKIHHTFINTENPMTCFIRRIGIRLPFGKATAFRAGESEGAIGSKDYPLPAGKSAALLSVGPPINHNGIPIGDGPKKDVTFNVFTYTGEGHQSAERQQVNTGKHALGQLTVLGEGKGCTISMRNLWRNHPNELSYAAKDGALECWVWANHGGKIIDTRNPAYNRSIRGEHRLGGKAVGWAKTHELVLNFHSDKQAQSGAETAKRFDHPVWPFVSPEWNCATEAIPLTHPYDPDRFPGLEKQIEILYAWVKTNQRQMHWDGFFGYGGVLIEFDNHGQRYSRGARGTWCWLDYAGFLNEDGQQSHHFFKHYYRTGRREYMEMGEAYVRRIADVVCVHHVNPGVKIVPKPGATNQLGTGHRHDMTAWHSFCSGYSMATFGSVDYYYLTGDERIRDNMEIYALRCDEDGLGPGYGGGHFSSSLLRFGEALNDPKMTARAKEKISKLHGFYMNAAVKAGFRAPTDLYPHMIMQEQMLNHKPTAEALLAGAGGRTQGKSEELQAWGYMRTKEEKYLNAIKKSMDRWKNKLNACAKLGDPWAMNWDQLRKAINQLPAWYVKVYINSQQLGRFPAVMAALNQAGLTEPALTGGQVPPYLGAFKPPALIKSGDPYRLNEISFVPAKSKSPVEAALFYRVQGAKQMQKVALKKTESGRYAAEVPATATQTAFEYYLEFKEEGQKIVTSPAQGAEKPERIVPDITPPSKVGNLRTAVNKDYQVKLAWDPAKDDKGIAGYRIFKGATPGFAPAKDALLGELDAKSTAFADEKPPSGKSIVYAVQAKDLVGREGALVYLEVNVPKNEPPGNALHLQALPSSRSISLAWKGPLEPDVTELEILRGPEKEGDLVSLKTLDPKSTNSYLDKGLKPGARYRYAIKLKDRAGLASPVSKAVAGVALGFVRRINCGGHEVMSPDGVAWEADRKRSSSMSLFSTKEKIKGIPEALQPVYQSERWSYSQIYYSFDVGAGRYRMILHFAETNKSFGAAGKRVFDVLINEEKIREKLDVFTEAKALNTGWKLEHTTTVKEDEGLTVKLVKNPKGPMLKGIEVMEILGEEQASK